MNKITILKYIRGTASEDEIQNVEEWVQKSPDNKKYLLSIMNSLALMPSDCGRVQDSQYEAFLKRAKSRPGKRVWRTLLKYAAVVVLLLSIALNITLFSNIDRNASNLITYTQSVTPDSLFQEIYVVKGAKSKVLLPDSSVVWLNSDSKIRFPLAFSSNSREVELSGEAYFDVVKDSIRPMRVSVTGKDYYIKVLGTQFNVRAYEDENLVQATLYTGKINIMTESGKRRKDEVLCEMIPNQVSTIKGRNISVKSLKQQNINNISSWKEGILYFDETPMKEVIRRIERWHGVVFEVKDNGVYDYTLTAKFDNESAVQILEMIKLCTPINYTIEDKTVSISLKK